MNTLYGWDVHTETRDKFVPNGSLTTAQRRGCFSDNVNLKCLYGARTCFMMAFFQNKSMHS